jgi:hypothetical protein
MRFFCGLDFKFSLIVSALVLFICGCSTVGPTSINRGRADYNEAINRTDDEQLLMSLVRGRYGETSRLLAVTSVAANVRFGANAGAEVQFGEEEFSEWSVVPFRGGVAYEDNPTITYAPVQGEQYLLQIMSPISLKLLILALRSSLQPAEFFTLLVKRINDIQNPDFLTPPLETPDSRFSRLVALLKLLSEVDVIHWVNNPQRESEFSLVIRNYALEYFDKVRELLNLLGLQVVEEESKEIELPIIIALKASGYGGIAIETRSTLDLIQIFRASVEVPDEHVRLGLVIDYPPKGLAGKGIRIRMSKERPENASIAVNYNKYWFYIDRADQRTKMAYRTLRSIWDITIANSTEQQSLPVLTVPVSH